MRLSLGLQIPSGGTKFLTSNNSRIYYRHSPVKTRKLNSLSRRRQHLTKTRLTSFSCCDATVRAASALLGSSLIGYAVDRLIPNISILVTMAVAALLSNADLVPSHHNLYDLCWTTFLPASLALLLLANSNNGHENNPGKNQTDSSIQTSIQTVSIPFIMASIGSIIGCALSFLVCRQFPLLWLQPKEAAIAASCLCASFIGGSVNFFATANLISSGIKTSTTTLMGSMAAADLLVMAIYFAFMTASLQSKFLTSLFGGKVMKESSDTKSSNKYDQQEDTNTEQDKGSTFRRHSIRTKGINTGANTVAGIFVSLLALCIVKVSSFVERITSPIIPGTTCAAIAILAPIMQNFLSKKNGLYIIRRMQQAATPLSDFCFLLLFASIGVCANLSEALRSGPTCLCFSLLALTVHIVIVFVGSLRIKQWVQIPFFLEDVLIASNAAIGGPATAVSGQDIHVFTLIWPPLVHHSLTNGRIIFFLLRERHPLQEE